MDPSEILKMLNDFYTNAFSQLMTLAIAIFGLGGIILPIVSTFLQNRSLKNERDSLMSQMKNELQEDIQKKFDDERKKIKKETNKKVLNVQGMVFFQQALSSTKEEDFINAAMSYCWTIGSLLTSKDDMNAGRAVDNLISTVLPFIYKEDYEESDQLSESIEKLIEKMEENNSGNKYFDDIGKIKELVKKGKTKSRIKSRTTTSK